LTLTAQEYPMHTTTRRKILRKRGLTFIVLWFSLASVAIQHAAAQPGSIAQTPAIVTWTAGNPAGSGTGNWNTAANWSSNAVPNVATEDSAIINGGGTAQINSVIANNAGSVVLGQGTAAGESGTLEIQNLGRLNVVRSPDPQFPADGSVRVGQNVGQGLNAQLSGTNGSDGTGTLRVLPGGRLDSVSLSLGGTVNSSMTLGGTAAGATVINTGAVTLGRTTRVIGPNVNFTSSGTGARITLTGTSIFTPEITGATHSALKTTGPVELAGTLQADFNGVTPALGQSWNIFDAASVTGAFAALLPDPGVPLGTAQRIASRTVAGGTNGRLVQMFIQQLPVLTVNRATGAIAITNPGTAGLPLDGYTIQSNAGSLSLANWQSLEDNPGVAGTNWFESNPSNNRLSELRTTGTSDVPAGGSWALGNAFQPPPPTQFGQNVEDLVFQVNEPVTQSTVSGIVNYVGAGNINNLVLFVDPATGNVKIRNTSPFTVQIDGYTITSASGALNSNPALWTSLQDQPGVAPNWFEGALTDNRVSEVMSAGTTTLTGNSQTTFDLGGLFKTAGARDLGFQFLLAGNSLANTGVVVYEAAPTPGGVTGDFNDNGTVDAADYVLWRNGGPLENDPTPGVQPGDYNVWRTNFGRMAGAGASLASAAVPEPATAVILLGMVAGLAAVRHRR
jgi:hypothetical protein